jgi:hypothetical protein
MPAPSPCVAVSCDPEFSVIADERTLVTAYNVDALDRALELRGSKMKPLIHVCGDPWLPGGYVTRGGAGVEESLFRRSNVSREYTQVPPPGQGALIKQVSLFKTSEKLGWRTFKSALVDVLITSKDHGLHEAIELSLQTAHANGNDSVVFSHMWQFPPEACAHAFASALAQYAGVFKHVAFSLPDTYVNTAYRCALSQFDGINIRFVR